MNALLTNERAAHRAFVWLLATYIHICTRFIWTMFFDIHVYDSEIWLNLIIKYFHIHLLINHNLKWQYSQFHQPAGVSPYTKLHCIWIIHCKFDKWQAYQHHTQVRPRGHSHKGCRQRERWRSCGQWKHTACQLRWQQTETCLAQRSTSSTFEIYCQV